jgi:hypothetical protein
MGGYGHARRDAREKLASSLESGDLEGAKAAWQRLKELGGGRMFRQFRGEGGATTTLRNDFRAVGTALKAGDLEGAKTALGILNEHLQAARAVHNGQDPAEVSVDVMPPEQQQQQQQQQMSISMTITYISVSFSYASSSAATTGTQLDVAG